MADSRQGVVLQRRCRPRTAHTAMKQNVTEGLVLGQTVRINWKAGACWCCLRLCVSWLHKLELGGSGANVCICTYFLYIYV